MSEIRELIDQVEKSLPERNIWFLSTHLIDYYFSKIYTGKEHDKIQQEYALYVWLDLVEWLFQNYHNIHLSDKKDWKKEFNFKKSILKAKIETYDWRKRIFFEWIGSYGKDVKLSTSFVATLRLLYPSFNEMRFVKSDLGLTDKVETLQTQLKELQ